jgi:hypothetical protein
LFFLPKDYLEFLVLKLSGELELVSLKDGILIGLAGSFIFCLPVLIDFEEIVYALLSVSLFYSSRPLTFSL